jgi:hypothetical protein
MIRRRPMEPVPLSKSKRSKGKRRAQRVVLVNPPAIPARASQRSALGGLGHARWLGLFEKEPIELLPLDVLYLGAAAEHGGAKVTFIDLLLERLQGTAAVRFCAQAMGPVGTDDVWVGVRLSKPSLRRDLEFAGRLRQRLPGVKVFVFGPVILATLDDWVSDANVDFVFYGEAEALMEKVLAAVDPSRVPGVIDPRVHTPLDGADARDEAKASKRFGSWVRVERLATLPAPAWHLVDLSRYVPHGSDVSALSASVRASRGCPLGTPADVAVLLEGRAWRSDDVERVVDELEYLNRELGISRIRFRDAVFGYDRKVALALADAIIERNLSISATIESTLELLDPATLLRLRQAGIRLLVTRIETVDELSDGLAQKTHVGARLKERAALCHQIGVRVSGIYRLGAPEETWETVERTWKYATELGVDSRFDVSPPDQGTPAYFRALRDGLLQRNPGISHWTGLPRVRSYVLTNVDLGVAAAWARLETSIARGKRDLGEQGPLALVRFYRSNAPEYLWRAACHGYVALRKRFPGATVFPEAKSRSRKRGSFAPKRIEATG